MMMADMIVVLKNCNEGGQLYYQYSQITHKKVHKTCRLMWRVAVCCCLQTMAPLSSLYVSMRTPSIVRELWRSTTIGTLASHCSSISFICHSPQGICIPLQYLNSVCSSTEFKWLLILFFCTDVAWFTNWCFPDESAHCALIDRQRVHIQSDIR